MTKAKLNAVDKVEILTLQDNYTEMTAMNNSALILRAARKFIALTRIGRFLIIFRAIFLRR